MLEYDVHIAVKNWKRAQVHYEAVVLFRIGSKHQPCAIHTRTCIYQRTQNMQVERVDEADSLYVRKRGNDDFVRAEIDTHTHR